MNTGNLLQTKRIEYIDIAKGLGMILVVIGHSINGMSFPGLWTWSFHMPLFFILSGLCFTDNKYPTFIPFLKKRIKTLLLPSIYFSLLVAVLSFILLKRNIFPDLTVNLPGALWFVLVLFFTEIFYYPIFKFTKENKISRIIILISLLIFGLCLSREKIVLPFSLSSIPIASFYYGIGHSYKTLINKITTTHIIRFKIFISFLLLIIPAIVTFYSNKSINMNGNHFSQPELLYIIISLSGTIGIILLSTTKLELYKKIFLYIGKNTLIILSLHMFFISLSSNYIQPFINNDLVYKSIEQAIIWILTVISITFINKKAIWLLGK